MGQQYDKPFGREHLERLAQRGPRYRERRAQFASGMRAPGGISPSVKTCLRRETTSSCIMSRFSSVLDGTILHAKMIRTKQIRTESCCARHVLHSKLPPKAKLKFHPGGSVNKMNENVTLCTDLLYEVRDGIGRIIFNRPQARNSLTFGMYERLAAICEAAASDSSLKVLILTGAGEKAFAAGTDINQFRAFNTPQDAIDYEARIVAC